MPFLHHDPRRPALYFWLTLGGLAAVVTTCWHYFNTERAIDRANEQRYSSYLLADELRQSSDDLTRMIRAYVATGIPAYKHHYQEILDIREGKKPRPADANNVYWDLVLSDDLRPRPFDRACPLLELMRRAGFTSEEFARLSLAKTASDALTSTEYAAMALVEATTPATEANRLVATAMLNDAAYYGAKAQIMGRIGDFNDLVNQRTLQAVDAAKRDAAQARALLGLMIVLLALLLWRLIAAIYDEKRISHFRLERLVEVRTAELSISNEQLKAEGLAREQATEALQESERRFRFIAENTDDVIWVMTLATREFLYVSPSVQHLLGYSAEEAAALSFEATLTPESAARADAVLAHAVTAWEAGQRTLTRHVLEFDQLHKHGHIVHTEAVTKLCTDDCGRPTSILGVTRDTTERWRAEQAIRDLAFRDALTRLPNRRLLQERVEQSIARAKRERNHIALLFIDLDRFKPINDKWGHEVGDWLLTSVAERLQACLRESDTAARVGGDEFIVLLSDVVLVEDALGAAERIRSALDRPYMTKEGKGLEVTSSIGVAIYPDHAENPRDLIRVGDEAMYQAKRAGRNQIEMLPLPSSSRGLPAATMRAFVHVSFPPGFVSRNPTIDSEHRALFRLSNRLLESSMSASASSDRVLQSLDELLACLGGHFENEEAILRQYGYARLAWHVSLHEQLMKRSRVLRQHVAEGSIAVGDLVEFVAVDVISSHLLEADRDYFPLLAESGLFMASKPCDRKA
jgi:diguanylate cyclase (GGDEF)-like protein/hemerythrin-like metal-binding protein/PAS domain S-box-containing protein